MDQQATGQAVRIMDKKGLIQELRSTFRLEWTGIHGAPHWARVRQRGLAIADITGADVLVVELFSFLHDSHRSNDFRDPFHGQKAADYALKLNSRFFSLTNMQMEKLYYAICRHSDGEMHKDATIQTCWDADRLDLWRVGVEPDVRLLSPQGARLMRSDGIIQRQSNAKTILASRF